MNTLQLKRALERDTFTKKIFGGVFAADELPKTFDTSSVRPLLGTQPHELRGFGSLVHASRVPSL